jgi:hypothetical protein
MYSNAIREAGVLRDALNLSNVTANLDETHRSRKEAHMVGRMTQLAFIFLPLSFITGLFGMNMFEGNTISLWQFWTTTACILPPVWTIGTMTLWENIEDKYYSLRDIRDFVESPPQRGARWYLEWPIIATLMFLGTRSARLVMFVLELSTRLPALSLLGAMFHSYLNKFSYIREHLRRRIQKTRDVEASARSRVDQTATEATKNDDDNAFSLSYSGHRPDVEELEISWTQSLAAGRGERPVGGILNRYDAVALVTVIMKSGCQTARDLIALLAWRNRVSISDTLL